MMNMTMAGNIIPSAVTSVPKFYIEISTKQAQRFSQRLIMNWQAVWIAQEFRSKLGRSWSTAFLCLLNDKTARTRDENGPFMARSLKGGLFADWSVRESPNRQMLLGQNTKSHRSYLLSISFLRERGILNLVGEGWSHSRS